MKKFILLAMSLLVASVIAGAQTTKVSEKTSRQGDTFVSNNTKAKADSNDQVTAYKWRDSKGNEYPIVIHEYTRGEKAGHFTCYVWRTSKKTGKEYKYFIPDGEAIANTILKENE